MAVSHKRGIKSPFDIMKESYLFLAAGFEEVEALTAVDLLRRAAIDVKTVSISGSLQVTGAHGITVTADLLFADTSFDDADWLILPGGMPGATNLYEFKPLATLLSQHASGLKNIAAICASPGVVLGQLGLLKGRKATCYPGFEPLMEGAEAQDQNVVTDGNFVLANGPASAMAWALAIIASAKGAEAAGEVAQGLLYNRQ